MKSDLETQEMDVLEHLRIQYEGKGYRFIVEPDTSEIPAFLEGVVPDAIAVGRNDSVVIEVKSTNASASQSAAVRFLAVEVPKHDGWRFDLVIADKGFGTTDASVEPTSELLIEELSSVQRSADSGEFKIAVIMGWALLEAFARRLILNQKAGEPKRYLPRTIIETLVSEGFADDETGTRLSALANARNRLVHGFTRQEVHKQDVDWFLAYLRTLTKELV